MEFGALVSAIGYRNPALVSDMAKTIDHMSGGRFILGLGAGWKVEDYQEFGYHMATPPERLRELRQGIETILQRWSVDVPPPVRNPIPIMIGGGGEKVTLRLTALDTRKCGTACSDPTPWPRRTASSTSTAARSAATPPRSSAP